MMPRSKRVLALVLAAVVALSAAPVYAKAGTGAGTGAPAPSAVIRMPDNQAYVAQKGGRTPTNPDNHGVGGFIRQEATSPSSTPYTAGGAAAVNHGARAWAAQGHSTAVRRAQRLAAKYTRRAEQYKKSKDITRAAVWKNNLAAEVEAEGATLGKIGGSAINAYSIYDTASTYMEEKHRHSSIQLFVRSVKGFDMGMNVADTVTGKVTAPAAITSGLVKDAVDSDAFADWCNRQDNALLDFADTQVDLMNDFYQNLFYNWWFRPAQGVGVYKPNIYLYPQSAVQVEVAFAAPGLLTATIPQYTGGWTVTADPGGTLTGGDDSTYGFLFYECLTDPARFRLSAGYVVPADGRDARFREILGQWGLNGQEIDDFCAFWNEKLDGETDYTAYVIATEEVDSAMPIAVSPAPDTVLRLWFAFTPYDGKAPAAPAAAPLQRTGFTLVEWGGLLLP